MNKVWTKFKKMSVKKRIQFILALLCTIGILISIPVYAWFSHQRQIAELQKIKTPDLLYISAAYAEDVKYFNISSIDVSDENNTAHRQCFAFAVAGEYVTSFTLQLGHTTNIPFTYKIYEAKYYNTEQEAKNAIDVYNDSLSVDEEDKHLYYDYDAVEYDVKAKWTMLEYDFSQRTLDEGAKLYLVKGNQVSGRYLNSQNVEGRTIATGKYHEETYKAGDGTYDTVQTYAEPLYWQSSSVQSVPNPSGWGGHPFFKTFMLEVSWDPETVTITNDKETDMIYLSVFRD